MAPNRSMQPIRLSHVGIHSYDVARLRDWYCNVLNAKVVSEDLPDFCVIASDEEHHRIAFGGLTGPKITLNPAGPGIMHTAFAVANVGDWLSNYERLRDQDIKPVFALHHGVSLSTYYTDPDGNACELFVDKFQTGQEAKEYFKGAVFRHTLGVSDRIDVDALLERWKAGASDEELMHYDEEAALKMDRKAVLAKVMNSIAQQPAPADS